MSKIRDDQAVELTDLLSANPDSSKAELASWMEQSSSNFGNILGYTRFVFGEELVICWYHPTKGHVYRLAETAGDTREYVDSSSRPAIALLRNRITMCDRNVAKFGKKRESVLQRAALVAAVGILDAMEASS